MKMIKRYRAPRRAVYLGSGSLVALGGASLGCYRSTCSRNHPPPMDPITIDDASPVGLPLPWWPILGRSTSLSYLSSSCTQVIIFSRNKILKTLLPGFGLGYGPIVFMLQGGYFVHLSERVCENHENLYSELILQFGIEIKSIMKYKYKY